MAETRELNLQDELRKAKVRCQLIEYSNMRLRDGLENGTGRAAELGRQILELKRDRIGIRREKAEVAEQAEKAKGEAITARREVERLKVNTSGH